MRKFTVPGLSGMAEMIKNLFYFGLLAGSMPLLLLASTFFYCAIRAIDLAEDAISKIKS